MTYKRNQIEEALSVMFASPSGKPRSELRTRIKRLLEWDRELGRKPRSNDPEAANFAFFSEDAPGTGAEVWFSDYEAFSILTALRIMNHGWPRGFAVSIMRRVGADLMKQHTRILGLDPKQLFDEEVIRRNARPGAIAVDNTDPVFLALVSSEGRDSAMLPVNPICAICRGMEEVSRFANEAGARSSTFFELATLTHRLSEELKKTEPRHRGRG